MTITLTALGMQIELPEDLVWADEFTWSAVTQAKQRGIFGTLIVHAMQRNGGMPITLEGEGDSAWIQLVTIKQLRAWAKVPGQRMQLDINGAQFTVIFDHGEDEETKAMGMEAVVRYSDPQNEDYYCSLVLRFIDANEIV